MPIDRYESLPDKDQVAIKDAYILWLIDQGYSLHIVEETSDGRDAFLVKEFEIYRQSAIVLYGL